MRHETAQLGRVGPFPSSLNVSKTAEQGRGRRRELTYKKVECSWVKLFERLVNFQRRPTFLAIHRHVAMIGDAQMKLRKWSQTQFGREYDCLVRYGCRGSNFYLRAVPRNARRDSHGGVLSFKFSMIWDILSQVTSSLLQLSTKSFDNPLRSVQPS
jgi:hypothetical protein